MNTEKMIQARQAVQNARQALKQGDRYTARRWAEQAAQLAPNLEDPWLILAAVSEPQTGIRYLQRALQINPDSKRAHKGMQWARSRLETASLGDTSPVSVRSSEQVRSAPRNKKKASTRKSWFYPAALLVLTGCVALLAAWSASYSPVFASILSGVSEPTKEPQLWARAEIVKPTYTASPTNTATPTATFTPTATATNTPLPTPTYTPTFTPSPTFTPLPALPTSTYSPPADNVQPLPTAIPPAGKGEHWIDVDLTNQRLYAYEGNVIVNSFVVSTGTWQTPTVTGKYRVYVKFRYTTMAGPGYYLPDVPYTMYFYKGYAIHGTYWHNNFGTPMSHGCINLTISDAAWVYDFSSVGTLVNIHY
ncbi:MAG: L,D-transpeptidase family protein [Anaerolineales bacterium]|nr:L,D-transpeptidase family protein [Anaerolineales bacterium]